jgi:pyridoxamine 5'-phosphate oxidase
MTTTDLAVLREDYRRSSLDEAQLLADPYLQFDIWFTQARQAQVPEPNAMTLATVDANGQPSARIVLLKGLDARGFVFFTNYESRKGQAITSEPRAALLFCWLDLERQVRIEGRITKVDASESDAYFASRPRASQIGARVSPQSRVIANREILENALDKESKENANQALTRPTHWGGYRLEPSMFEFWQGRSSRLHDRLRYLQSSAKTGAWTIDRLAP